MVSRSISILFKLHLIESSLIADFIGHGSFNPRFSGGKTKYKVTGSLQQVSPKSVFTHWVLPIHFTRLRLVEYCLVLMW